MKLADFALTCLMLQHEDMRSARPNPIVRWELVTLAERGVLDDHEVVHELEDVMLSERSGVLVVTDVRIVFVRTSLFRRRMSLESVLLSQIASVETLDDPVWVGRWGSLVINTVEETHRRALRFDRIRGGRQRAQEIGDAIMGRLEDLRRPPAISSLGTQVHVDTSGPSLEVAQRLRVSVGRGVAQYVKSRGGRLYVWGQPIGALQWMKAATERPDAVAFVPLTEVSDFELYVAEDLVSTRWLRLVRRWWLPGGGIGVDTGLVLG